MKFQRRVRRTRQGEFEIRLSTEERDVLRSVPAQVRDALTTGDKADPAVARLHPTAYPDDPDLDNEYQLLMGEDLDEGRLNALQTFEDSVDATVLEEAQALAWLRAVNDTRLLLGTRLEVSEDPAQRVVVGEGLDCERRVALEGARLVRRVEGPEGDQSRAVVGPAVAGLVVVSADEVSRQGLRPAPLRGR